MLRWLRKGIRFRELETNVRGTSLAASRAINDAWASVTGEQRMSAKFDFIVRMEMVWFFLHVVNRTAFHIRGPQARALVQDAVAHGVVKKAVKLSFDIDVVRAQEGFDAERWATEGLNETELDYSSCTELFGESSGPVAWLDDQSVVGRLGKRIAEAAGHEQNQALRLLIAETATKALAVSGLVAQVDRACSLAR